MTAGGARLHVQEWGAGPTLLCVHGLGGGGHFFSALGPLLADACRTVAVDLPGCSLSPAAANCTFEEAAATLIDLIRQEGWSTCRVLGHSMGTIVALEIAREAPELLAGLILVGGLPEPRGAARARISNRIAHVRAEGLTGVGEQTVAANFSLRSRQERPEVTGLFARAFELQSADAYIRWAETLCGWAARPLPVLEPLPCLLVTGDEDLYAPPGDVEAFADSLRTRRSAGAAEEGRPTRGSGTVEVQIMRDCAHLPFLEQPQAFAALVRQFLLRAS